MPHPSKARAFHFVAWLASAALLAGVAWAQVLTSADLSRLRSIGSVALSPDGHFIVYTITMRDRPGRSYGQLWVMDLSTGKSLRLGGDKPAGAPLWSNDSRWIAFRGEDGDKQGLVMVHPDGSAATFLATLAGSNSPLPGMGKPAAWSPDGKQIAFVSATPGEDAAQAGGDPMVITRYTDLNQELFAGKAIADVESFTFVSNDNRFEVEAFLTKPIGMTTTSKHPLIVVIHGGPHGQNGPGFNFHNQVYAAHGYAVLNVNYRGSTGYGQGFADAVFRDQNGDEGQDVLYAVSAAVNAWGSRE